MPRDLVLAQLRKQVACPPAEIVYQLRDHLDQAQVDAAIDELLKGGVVMLDDRNVLRPTELAA